MALFQTTNAFKLSYQSTYCLKNLLRISNQRNAKYNLSLHRCFAKKVALKDYNIIWNEPAKLPDFDPVQSGDLEPFNSPELSRPIVELQNVEEQIKQCDEVTQKLLSIEFGGKGAILNAATKDYVKKVQNHQYDFNSREVRVARLTAKVRYLQMKLNSPKGLVPLEIIELNSIVGERNKEVKLLRKECYKKFEWILDQLNIIHKPEIRIHESITRKSSLRKLIDMRYYTIKEKRLEEYKNKLELQKEPFLAEKLEVMQWIADTEAELGLPVTVDVLEAEQQLKDYRNSKKTTQESLEA